MTIRELKQAIEYIPDNVVVMITDFSQDDNPIPNAVENIKYLREIERLFIEGGNELRLIREGKITAEDLDIKMRRIKIDEQT